MQKLGPYEIRVSLGQGGGGEVFRAWDPRLQRDVALKILHERFESDPERVRSFVAEARAASALNHPNIVTVFDAAVDGGTPYIVSELIDGRPLREEMDRGPVPIKRLLDLATQIADGLAAAHEAGIRHGDLKPENLMITRAGRAKVVDFGLTRGVGFHTDNNRPEAEDSQTQTVAGLVVGTVPYMSPEQARGLAASFPSDQFSFGLVLYEMTTGRRAFRGATPAATLNAIINDEPAPIPPSDSRIPLQLRWIVERCLAKNPDDRYGATSDLHRDLKILRDRLSEATTAGPAATAPRRLRTAIIAGAAGLLLLAAGALVSNAVREPAAPDLSVLSFIPLISDPGYQGHPAFSPNAETIAYSAEVDGKLQIFTRKISSSQFEQLTFQPADCTHPFWSGDGRIYFISQAHDTEAIWSIAATGGTAQPVVLNAFRGAISRDGRTIAFLRNETRADIIGTASLWIATPPGSAPWDYETVEAAAKRREGFGGGQFIEGALAFSPDGQKLGLCVVPGPHATESIWQFWVVPLPAGQEYQRLATWSEPAARISNFTWLPDNRRIVLGVTSLHTPGSHLWLADLERDRVWPLTVGPDSQSYPSASSSGDQVVFANGEPDYDLSEIDLDKRTQQTVAPMTRNELDAVYSPDGREIAYVTDRSGQDEIWVRTRGASPAEGARISQSDFGADRTLMLSSPSYSPDGKFWAFQRNGLNPRKPLRIWISATTGGTQRPLLPRARQAIQSAATWSKDSQSIAFSEWNDNQWQLLKVSSASGEEPVILRKDGVANATPHWSPNGDLITWETEKEFLLVLPDGRLWRPLDQDVWPDDPWLVHTWSSDGREIIGIKQTLERRLRLVAVPIDAKVPRTARELRDLGPSPPVNNPVKGLSVSTDDKFALTSIARLRGDIWVLSGLDRIRPASRWW